MDKYISTNTSPFFAFNIWNIESAKAVMDGAFKMQRDVILQTSVKAFDFLDKSALRWFVDKYRREKGIQVYLHLDHSKSLELIREAIYYGWDSVMIDASDQPLEENIRRTNEVCAFVRKQNKDILVEAEIGQIGTVGDEIFTAKANVARIEDIKQFVQNVDIDLLAVAIGTSHGQYLCKPSLRYDLIDQTGRITNLPLVIHGGTGLTNEMFLRLLSYKNVKKINVSTDIKLAFRQGIKNCIQNGFMEEKGFNPICITGMIHDSIENMTMNKLKLLRD